MDSSNNKGSFSFWQQLIPKRWKRGVTQEDIETIIDSGQKTGLIDEDGNEMIHRILEMKDVVVREVMVPRTDILALEVNSSIEDVIKLVVNEGHSRVPVYDETIDKIVGIVYAKDLLKHLIGNKKSQKIIDIMRKPLFVPETKNIDELFKELKNKHIHIAIVVDEYGGTSGLVTIEDLIEEIVGDIQDEHDAEEEEFAKVGEDSYIADAKIDIDDLSEKINVEIPKEDFDTLGGFLVHMSNNIPSVRDEIAYKNILFTVIDADERKVSKVGIKIISESASDGKLDPPAVD
ncbi:MAG: hemolysin family protein [bacterium]|nr:hemolysin family protein [bacterium]